MAINSLFKDRSHCGITVLEVLFAMVVAVVGLMGIASLLPVAARNARESNSFNFVQGAAQGWFSEVSTRGLNNYGGWKGLADYPPMIGFMPVAASRASGSVTQTASTITAQQINRVWSQQAICLDPYFFTDPIVRSSISQAVDVGGPGFSANIAAYRPAVFPYYQDGHNPVSDPFNSLSPWQDQPRMVRVTLDAPLATAIPSALRQVDRKYVEMLFTANDDFATFADETQRDLPATRLFANATNTPLPIAGKAISGREFSWMATMTPREPQAVTPATTSDVQSEYSVSLVVFRSRDMSWVTPTDISPGTVENKPAGERLVWVYPLSGNFERGSGGRVRLISNAAVNDSVHVGDWIMLGKHFLIDTSAPLNRYAYFRWYRIVAVDADARLGTLGTFVAGGDPYGAAMGSEVWVRDVAVEGPDWDFTSPIAGITTPTTGTLMKNVITVIDRTTNIP